MARDLIVPFTGYYTKDQAEERQGRLRIAGLIFRRRFWRLAHELYKFYQGQAFRHFGYNSMSDYLDAGNAVVGRSWGMFMIAAHYQYKVALPAILDAEQTYELEFMLQSIKSENLQTIQPQVNRLMARASGHPLPSDPLKATPITMPEAVDGVLALVGVAHSANTESQVKQVVGDTDGKPLKASFAFHVGELPPAVLDWWASKGMPTDDPNRRFYGVANEDRNEFNGQ